MIGIASSDESFTCVQDEARDLIVGTERKEIRNERSHSNMIDDDERNTPDLPVDGIQGKNKTKTSAATLKSRERIDINHAASYVSQLQFRSSENHASNIEFYFKNEPLSGNGTVIQLFCNL